MIAAMNQLSTKIFWLFIFVSCILAFIQASDSNYRSTDGFLGRTTPPFQAEIVAGIAPAPYVYRQGIPQLRATLTRYMQPGHAALVVDTLFALAAMGAAAYLARLSLGKDLAFWGVISATLACAAVYPNDKPEAVAAVGCVVLISALVMTEQHRTVAAIAVLSALIRPEIPILLGIAMILTAALVRQKGELPKRNITIPYTITILAGISYLLLARYVLWPVATYPQDTPVLMLFQKLADPLAWPGVVLASLIISLGASWIARGTPYMYFAKPGQRAPQQLTAIIGLGFFVCFSTGLLLLVARTQEIPIFQPLVPVVVILGIGKLQSQGAQSPNCRTF